MRSVSFLLDLCGDIIAILYPGHKAVGRKQVSLTNNHALAPEWSQTLRARTQYFTSVLLLVGILFFLVIKSVVEVYFSQQTVPHILYELLTISVLYMLVWKVLLPKYGEWYDWRAAGYIQEGWLTIGWPWEFEKAKCERKYGPLNSPEKRLKWAYVDFACGDWITAEHMISGICMLGGGFFGGSAMWFRHGLLSHAAFGTCDLANNIYNTITKRWNEDETWKKWIWNMSPHNLWHFIKKNPILFIHHSPTWAAMIPLILYHSSNPVFQLSCGILAGNPQHFFEHSLWFLRYTALEYDLKKGTCRYNPKRRGSFELFLLMKVFNMVWLFNWRLFLFNIPLGWFLLQRFMEFDFSYSTLTMATAYICMSWFNFKILAGDWMWYPLVKRFAVARGAKACFDEAQGGNHYLIIPKLQHRFHLANEVLGEVERLQEHSPLEMLDALPTRGCAWPT